ncbi:MAG: Phospholipid/glycerol acyltransferase [Pedosphaera sp.]|nr:Phospholipid/glycerol acyltransferase [Pedosphaera sp.]
MKVPGLYGFMRAFIRLALGFYFRRIERFHPERIPEHGPVLFTSNHPNSLTDSFVIGAAVPRKVNFVATVQLFRFKPLKWLLTSCGVIPINRVKDDPRSMRSVADTFEACYQVLEQGEAIGIFPEGITHDDPQLKTVKTGAAHMALELEHRHAGKLGLQIVPVGLNLSAKEKYRSEVLVNFGQPIRAADFLEGYATRKKECIHELNDRIEQSIQQLILHIPQLEHVRVVDAVKRLYLDRLLVASNVISEPVMLRAEELRLTQRIADAVEYIYRTQPVRAAAFAQKLNLYEMDLARLKLSEESLMHEPQKRKLAWLSFYWASLAILGLPIAAFGWLHRLIPFLTVKWAIHRFANTKQHKAQTSTAAIVAGLVSFGICYTIYIFIFRNLFSWHATLWYALSLPVTGIIAHYYIRKLRRLGAGVWDTVILLRAPSATHRLRNLRSELASETEATQLEINQSRDLSR